MNKEPSGYSELDYLTHEREEYNPELVKRLETGGYEVISDAVMGLFEINYPLDPEDENSAFYYKSDQYGVDARRTVHRVDSEEYKNIGYGVSETKLDISYSMSYAHPQLETIDIKIMNPTGDNDDSIMTKYTIEHYPQAGRIISSVMYPDIAFGKYNVRDMTPYDEVQVFEELSKTYDYIDALKQEDDVINRFA